MCRIFANACRFFFLRTLANFFFVFPVVEESALKVEFQKRLFVFPVGPAWRFNLELFRVLVCFCEAIWFRVKVQSWDFLYFGLFLWGLLTPNEGSVWVVLCWMAPSFPPKRARISANFWLILEASLPEFFPFTKMDPQKKIFRCAARDLGGALRAQRARGARAAREARYITLYLVWPCLNCFPEDSTFLRVFAHSTRASGGVIFNKKFATFQVSKTINKMGVFLHSTRSSEGVLF